MIRPVPVMITPLFVRSIVSVPLRLWTWLPPWLDVSVSVAFAVVFAVALLLMLMLMVMPRPPLVPHCQPQARWMAGAAAVAVNSSPRRNSALFCTLVLVCGIPMETSLPKYLPAQWAHPNPYVADRCDLLCAVKLVTAVASCSNQAFLAACFSLYTSSQGSHANSKHLFPFRVLPLACGPSVSPGLGHRGAMAAGGAVEQSYLVRRADPDDVDTIDALYDRLYGDGNFSEALAIFHAVDKGFLTKQDLRLKFLLSLVETSFMSVTVEDEEGHVVGFAVLDDTPLHLSASEARGLGKRSPND
eukprot:s942_g4.t3